MKRFKTYLVFKIFLFFFFLLEFRSKKTPSEVGYMLRLVFM